VRERPIAADMNGDGITDVGLFVPDRIAASPPDMADWYFLVTGNGQTVLDRIELDLQGNEVVHFTPEPFGRDVYARFGHKDSLPIVGNFDPPIRGQSSENQAVPMFRNHRNPLDVNNDGTVDQSDLQLVRTEL